MKKIGILTFHYVDNYGAVLQAWALQKTINSFPNMCAEIINYVPDGYMIRPYSRTSDGIERIKQKRARYENFLIRERMVTSPMQHDVCGNEYDYYISGSDQVWNLSFRENLTNQYLFPNLDKDAKRFSYAASAGDTIADRDKEIFKTFLQRFSAISVREEKLASQIAELGFDGVQTVLDPTLLLQAVDYEQLIEEPADSPREFLFFFSYPMGDEVRKWAPFVNTIARNNDLIVVHSTVNLQSEVFTSGGKTVIYNGIGEFLWYIKHARAIVTTSYHGAILGRLFERPTYIIRQNTGWVRLEQLSSVLGLEDMIVTSDWLLREWDIDKYRVYDNLPAWREKSIRFLRESLGME